jgi:serine/threonine protein kinase
MPMTSPLSADQSRLALDDTFIGRTISGKWRIEKKLGAGGMGTVYLATDLTVDRPVALKFLLPALAAETEYRARFEREARVMAKVDHPNLLTLYGVERDGEVPFLVMKYVTGRTLAKFIKDRTKLPLTEAMPLIRQMTSALTSLHSQGYVHRDLKPGNIIVSDEGHVTLLDFGLIRSHGVGLTRPGVALGSPFYMSPEQAIADTVDARSDLYTLAVVVTELLTGRRPFSEGDAHASLLAHLEKPPMAPHDLDPSVPLSVSEVLLHALEKKPAARQQSVAQFMSELAEAAAISATMVVQAPVAKKKGDSGKQRPIVDDEVELTRAESPSAGARRNARLDDDDESTVSAKSRARRALEPKKVEETDTGVPVVPAPSQPARGTMSSKRTLLETPMAVLPPGTKDSASTLVGLDTVNANSQQTLSAVSEVTPASTGDSSRTIAAINPVLDPSTDPSAPVLAAPTHTHDVLDPVSPAKPAPRRTLMDEQTAPLVYVGIGAGAVLIVALVFWILLS